MIQFNLLPDVKIKYIKAERNKRLVIVSSFLISAVSLAVMVVLVLFVFVYQKQHISGLTEDIAAATTDLNGTGDLSKILTIQNQLNSLSDLHAKKQVVTRILPYLQQITPVEVSLSNVDVDFETSTIVLTGQSATGINNNQLASVNKYVDTLKFTDYNVAGGDTARAFSDVVLTSFGRSATEATYSVTFIFDPLIFSNNETVSLTVPSQVTTRSETEKPTDLFKTAPVQENQ